MPRQYSATAEDRYILEEEGDVTEINFVISGEWAVAFNSYVVGEDAPNRFFEDGENTVPADMIK